MGTDDLASDSYNRFWRGFATKNLKEIGLSFHMIESLNNTGKSRCSCATWCVLFRGAAEGKIRTKTIEEDLIEAVIGLPSNLFFGTSIPAADSYFQQTGR